MASASALSRRRQPTDPVHTLDSATRGYVDRAANTFLPVANGTHFNGAGGGPVTNLIQARCRQSRKILRIIASGATELQVEWANVWTTNTPQALDATCEIAGPNSVTARMSIEYPAGNPRQISGSTAWSSVTAYILRDQVTHSGSTWVCIQAGTNQTPAAGSAYWTQVNRYPVRWETETDTSGTVAFAPGAYLKSLPIALQRPTVVGDLIAVLGAFDSGDANNRIPYAGANGACRMAPFVDWIVDDAGGLPAVGSALPDTGVTTQTNGSTTGVGVVDHTAWMKIPYATAITGNIPSRRCVALFGDSLVQGAGGDVRDGEPAGIFARAAGGLVWWRIAQGGNQAGCYVPGNAPWQMSVVRRCSVTVTNLAMNDIQAGNTTATVKARLLRLWRVLAAEGPPLYAGFLSPISNSTDAWATTANQSRWTGGVNPTTQFPNDDATYLTSVYGQVAMWLSQDGAEDTIDGVVTKVGQVNHPVTRLLDWRSLIVDQETSWKWYPATYTPDGAHPTTTAAIVEASYFAPYLQAAVLQAMPQQEFSVIGHAPVMSMARTAISRSSTTTSGSIVTAIGISPGRMFFGIRLATSTAFGSRSYSIMVGADPTKMKVITSGTTTTIATAITPIALSGGGEVWIPAGYLIAVALTTPAASSWAGQLIATREVVNTSDAGSATDPLIPTTADPFAKTGFNYVLAGTSADAAALSTGTVVSLWHNTKYSQHSFRAFAEAF